MRNRTDANQGHIIRAVQKIGGTVVDLSQVGGGVPDILIGFRGNNYLVEIKNPEAGGKLSDNQVKFVDNFNGRVDVIYHFDELLSVLLGKSRES